MVHLPSSCAWLGHVTTNFVCHSNALIINDVEASIDVVPLLLKDLLNLSNFLVATAA